MAGDTAAALITVSRVLPEDWLTTIAAIFGILGLPIVGGVALLFWRRGRSAKTRAEALAAAVAADDVRIKELEESLAQEQLRADAYDPYVWIAYARNERNAERF